LLNSISRPSSGTSRRLPTSELLSISNTSIRKLKLGYSRNNIHNSLTQKRPLLSILIIQKPPLPPLEPLPTTTMPRRNN
jgi:hypothetical protein